ncbi:glycosyltransferase family 61 protein [Roseovarius aestuariivivens]|uniref:glycosyltransferase family 61 protein n=1 Tax=Roseovarius aestuariivivens TaxID=1888910 RepID=UPI00108008BB|nr:glycosyltransferase 61 family protein [Roseovarius aestuariivivens]
MTAPAPDAPPVPGVEIVRNACVAPVLPHGRMAAGVFRADGSFVEASRTLLSRGRLTDVPPRPDPAGARRLPGRFLFAGPARAHFGHFLLESLGRLWPLTEDAVPPDGLLFLPPRADISLGPLQSQHAGLFDALCPGLPQIATTEPVVVEELIVPGQAFGHGPWITGTPAFRALMRSRLESAFPADGPERLYISRSRLRGAEKLVDGEARIEKLMRRAGYTVFHPERHDIATQVARYRAARWLVGPDGSAFHLAACVVVPGTRVGVIQRRHRPEVVQSFLDQFAAFAEVETHLITPLLPRERQSGDDRALKTAPINFRALSRQLDAAGFL